ncbi:tRNA 2-thiouridine(34) synthase MnmA [Planctomycetes bacterium K23_9]|uniref:tRNA-specific 2-thiouridylase MnmA n=1 Tax=Stieleria marina TaxID=1930275 RepID=A0A517NLY5_9BACT|nr:tRNA-specific 2-thiouridylase MnmA [Planctomycetes bacterium K23_9]
MARIVLAMSGGVDSSVAAHLLLDAGHEVIGVFMRHGEESAQAYGEAACQATGGDPKSPPATSLPVVGALRQERADHKQGCCTASDAADARRVASAMNIPFYALDLQQDFKRIVDYFVDDYLSGRTPNPCVKCNHWIKFGKLFDYADGVDADFVATGHYARMQDGGLHRGRDSNKDQSYALFGIRPDRLPRMMLPVGDFNKPRIREIAEELGLGVAGKKDSQEICFVTQGHHSDFVKSRRPDRVGTTSGNIVTTAGKTVGTHNGYEAFTVGQRKGLGVAMGSPHFVVRIETETNDVVIGPQTSLQRNGLSADDANWLIDPNDLPENVSVQFRYNGSPKNATVKIDPADATQFDVVFDEPQLAISPGQAAVVYHDTLVVGGGWIK